jgi:hypothetical protein
VACQELDDLAPDAPLLVDEGEHDQALGATAAWQPSLLDAVTELGVAPLGIGLGEEDLGRQVGPREVGRDPAELLSLEDIGCGRAGRRQETERVDQPRADLLDGESSSDLERLLSRPNEEELQLVVSSIERGEVASVEEELLGLFGIGGQRAAGVEGVEIQGANSGADYSQGAGDVAPLSPKGSASRSRGVRAGGRAW